MKTFFGFLIFLYLGFFLDISQKDIIDKDCTIVVLGGGEESRIIKGIELYFKNSAQNNDFIFTGNDFTNGSLWFLKKSELLLQSGILKNKIIQLKAENTFNELKILKEYLIKNKIKKVIIVTHPSHSRRVSILSDVLFEYKKDNIKLIYVSADHTKVWNKYFYFLNYKSIKLAFSELIKIVYNMIKYTIF
jgi:hypothetical protein